MNARVISLDYSGISHKCYVDIFENQTRVQIIASGVTTPQADRARGKSLSMLLHSETPAATYEIKQQYFRNESRKALAYSIHAIGCSILTSISSLPLK